MSHLSPSLSARVRRLSTTGDQLYVQFVRSELEQQGLHHLTPITLVLNGRCKVGGIVKTSGGTPWLAPTGRWSNRAITDALRQHGFGHGHNATASFEAVIPELAISAAATRQPIPSPSVAPLTVVTPPVRIDVGSTHEQLAAEVHRLARVQVRLWRWDDYILGRTARLEHDIMTAAQAAELENERWSTGRFPVVHLAIADGVFSKQKKYRAAVTASIYPFAVAWASTALTTFCELPWVTVFERTFGHPPANPDLPSHQHLTSEGRIRTILAAAKGLLSLQLTTVDLARDAMHDDATRRRVESTLMKTNGISDALTANICMNLGFLQAKLDTHVREVIHQTCGIAVNAPAAQFLPHLEAVASITGLHPFEIDQIIWYARAEPA